MGAWGTGLFCDDVACDVRTQFRNLLAEGRTIPQATRQILADWREAVADEDDGPVIWLALASLQWDCGTLQSRVKSQALRAIDSGADLRRWESTGDSNKVRQRKGMLDKLRTKLESPPSSPKKTQSKPKSRRKPYKEPKTNWPLGEVFAYRLLSGKSILLVVCDYFGHYKSGFAPIFGVLNWQGNRIPSAERIQQLPFKSRLEKLERGRVFLIAVGRASEKELPQDRITRLEIVREQRVNKTYSPFFGSRWKWFDEHLQEYLNWS